MSKETKQALAKAWRSVLSATTRHKRACWTSVASSRKARAELLLAVEHYANCTAIESHHLRDIAKKLKP